MVVIGQTMTQLQSFCMSEGLPKFAARQLCEWVYQKRVDNFDVMTNLSLKARNRLKEIASVGVIHPAESQISRDGTKKYLFKSSVAKRDGGSNYIETVYIPDRDRATLCVSCQVGCKMGCSFCYTGRQGFRGNLTVAEIVNQILAIPESGQITNVVFMGMGEPLDNYEAIRQTIEVLTAEWGLGWSPRRITVSTVGVTPMLKRLLDETECHVAVSLHNAFGEERAEMMPMERVYPIDQTIGLLKRYNWWGQRRLSFEYTMFQGINDDISHAVQLVNLVRGLHCRVNLIRFHVSPDMPYRSSDRAVMTAFQDYLNSHGVVCTIRASRGEDIMAACGLLSGRANESF